MRSTENFLKMLDKKKDKKVCESNVPKIYKEFLKAAKEELTQKTDIKRFTP